MPIALRSCLFPNTGRLRLLLPTFTRELKEGKTVLPEYAGQTLRHAMVSLEVDPWRCPLRITGIVTSLWDFDAGGDIRASIARREAESQEADEAILNQETSGQVVDLQPRLRRRQLWNENQWKVGLKEMNQIISAIWSPVHRR